MFRLLKYAFLILTFFYLISSFNNYSYADLALLETIRAESLFSKAALAYISKTAYIFGFRLHSFGLDNQETAAMLYLAFLRLSLPIMLCFKSYCLFSLFAAFCLLQRHKKAQRQQVNMHFQKVLNKYLLFIAFYVLFFLLFTAAAETLIYVSYILPVLAVLLIKAGLLYSGFPPYF